MSAKKRLSNGVLKGRDSDGLYYKCAYDGFLVHYNPDNKRSHAIALGRVNSRCDNFTTSLDEKTSPPKSKKSPTKRSPTKRSPTKKKIPFKFVKDDKFSTDLIKFMKDHPFDSDPTNYNEFYWKLVDAIKDENGVYDDVLMEKLTNKNPYLQAELSADRISEGNSFIYKELTTAYYKIFDLEKKVKRLNKTIRELKSNQK
jgi:hypothetical protein